MALAGGLLAGPHVARDSGASGYFCARSTRLVRAIDDSVFLSCGAARISRGDDACAVVRLRDRLGALPCVDSTAVECLNAEGSIDSGFKPPAISISVEAWCFFADFQYPSMFGEGFAVRTGAATAIIAVFHDKAPADATQSEVNEIPFG